MRRPAETFRYQLMQVPEPTDRVYVEATRAHLREARARAFEVLGVPDPMAGQQVGAARASPSKWKRWTRDLILEAIRRWAVEHGGQPPTAEEWQRGGDHPNYSTVVRVCGSWADAIADAGFERPRRGVRRDRFAA